MPIEITMPRLSDTMEEGTLIKWNVKVGDTVESGDVLADVETDKATMELPSFEEGTVAKLAVDEGQTLPVGKLICILAEEGEDVEEAAKAGGDGEAKDGEDEAKAKDSEKRKKEAKQKKAKQEASDDEGDQVSEDAEADEEQDEDEGDGKQTKSSGRVKASPVARKMAEENDLDLGDIEGSGPGGRIIKRDVQQAIDGGGSKTRKQKSKSKQSDDGGRPKVTAAPTPAPGMGEAAGLEEKTIPLTNMRKTIAKRLVESKTSIPHFTVTVSINMDPLLQLREQINSQLEAQGVKLSVNDFIVRATALACIQHPAVNSSWDDGSIQQHGTVNVGVAIALPADKGGGLVVATVEDVQHKGLRQLNDEVKQLAAKARGKGLSLDELQGSTITISNLGMPQYGVNHFTAIINPPNAAILAIGAAIEKPVVRDGEIVVGHEMTVTLSGDHRVIDGAVAAEYLSTLREILEAPAAILV